MDPKVKTIIWDWNGTLLDDVDTCVASMNAMLRQRDLKELDHERYRQIFTFPVRDYYEICGYDFEKESWDIMAHDFMDRYFHNVTKAGLHDNVVETLKKLKQYGYRQIVLSAMEKNSLSNLISTYGISDFFDHIAGISDHYAHSKVDVAKHLLAKLEISANDIMIIGDTLHDYEVAQELACRCILVSHGHQSKQRLLASGAVVVDTLKEVCKMLAD